jgi:hypothetical protein
MEFLMRTTRVEKILVSGLCLGFFAACSYTTDFSKKDLDFSVMQDAPEETGTPCENDCDCTLFGPCYSCQMGYCALAPDADMDNDKHLNVNCSVSDEECKDWPDEFRPRGGDDCRDDDPEVHPDRPEVCNGRDDNCNNKTDEDSDLFGPAGSEKKLLDGAYHFSFCPHGDIAYVAWDNDPAGSNARSGFFDSGGNLLSNFELTTQGMGPDLVCVPDRDASVVYSDRSEGRALVLLDKLDSSGKPVEDETLRIADEEAGAGDMTDAVVTYLSTTSPPLYGVAWLTHDINDIARARVGLRVIDSITGNPVEISGTGLPTDYFHIPGSVPVYSYEKLSVDTYSWQNPSSGETEQGFGVLWNQDDGIHFAVIGCWRDSVSGQMTCSQFSPGIYRPPGDEAVRFPDMEWAGDRFFAAFGMTAGTSTVTKLGFAEIDPGSWSITGLSLPEEEVEEQLRIAVSKSQTYPALEWVHDMNELILVWAHEPEFGSRYIRFARLKKNEAGNLELAVEKIYDISSAEKFAGAPQVLYRRSFVTEGFLVAWTEKSDDPGIGVVVETRNVTCLSEE